MKRRVAYFLLCLCFCFSTLSLSSSAVEYDPYTGFEFDFDTDKYYDPYTGQEMIYDESEGTWYSYFVPFDYEPIELYRLSSPNYSDFKISDLPWLEMPSYVQEIVEAQPIGLTNNSSYSGEYKLPFIAVIVLKDTVQVVAGYNLCVGAYFQSSTQKDNGAPYRYFLCSLKLNSQIYANSVCYFASYSRSDFSIVSAWKTLDPVAVGDNIVRYYNFDYGVSTRDSYFYGSSGMLAGRVIQTTSIESGETFPQYVTVNNTSSGFASGTIMYLPDAWGGYVGTFSPPTAEQLQASTSKGIWDTLKSIPGMIAENIKGLFIPSEGYFDSFADEFQVFFRDRLGFLYEVPELLSTVFDTFTMIDGWVTKSDYSIDFPEVVVPVLIDGEWHEIVLIEQTEIKFDFLEQGAFKTLYDLYCDLLWFIYIFALLGLIYRKSEKFFGGTTE